MLIIKKEHNLHGAYPAPQTWSDQMPPDGYAVIADTVDMADFYTHNGFVTLTIEAIEHTRQVEQYVEDEVQTVDEVYTIDTMTAYEPNIEAWEAWKASQPTPSEPEPTTEERITALEEQIAQADETAIELFEMQLAQEEINAAQDDALIEIYEMIGG